MKKERMAVLILVLSSCLFWVSIGYAQDSRFMSDRPWQEERGVPSIMGPEKAESAGSLNNNAEYKHQNQNYTRPGCFSSRRTYNLHRRSGPGLLSYADVPGPVRQSYDHLALWI